MEKLDEKYRNIYRPLIAKFMNDIETVNPTDLPVPFLPFYGENYEQTPYKIAFVGWETRDSVSLDKYISRYKEGSEKEEVYYWFNEDLYYPFYFIDYKYMNNTGRDFWGFIFQFLAKFYGISDWKELKTKKHLIPLQSFAWGNVDSIERWEVAKRPNANIEDYRIVKHTSKIFDEFNLLVKTLEPKIVLLLRWNASEKWLLKDVKEYERVKLNEYLWYYNLRETNTHIYWSPHPGYLARMRVNFNDFILQILTHIHINKIIEDFPGESFLKY